jgi:hypothetical protein
MFVNDPAERDAATQNPPGTVLGVFYYKLVILMILKKISFSVFKGKNVISIITRKKRPKKLSRMTILGKLLNFELIYIFE